MEQQIYKCPMCQHPLTSVSKFNRDFFCKSCFTAVAIINMVDCFMLPRGEKINRPCKLEPVIA